MNESRVGFSRRWVLMSYLFFSSASDSSLEHYSPSTYQMSQYTHVLEVDRIIWIILKEPLGGSAVYRLCDSLALDISQAYPLARDAATAWYKITIEMMLNGSVAYRLRIECNEHRRSSSFYFCGQGKTIEYIEYYL